MTATSGREQGITMVEVMITLLLLSIVLLSAGPALISGQKVVVHTSDDTQGLSDMRFLTERLSRDLRGARKVYSTSTASVLKIWVDDNADYGQSPDEVITWSLALDGSGPHYDFVRQVGTAPGQIVSQTSITGAAFTYLPAPETTRRVVVKVTYDADPGFGASIKTAGFEIRLRNVE